MIDNNDVIEAIDAKIATVQEEVLKLRKATEQLSILETQLALLKRTRGIFLNGNSERPATHSLVLGANADQSVGDSLIQILKEAGGPMTLDDIFHRFRDRGGESNRATVTSTLVRLMQRGVRRVGVGTYTLQEQKKDL